VSLPATCRGDPNFEAASDRPLTAGKKLLNYGAVNLLLNHTDNLPKNSAIVKAPKEQTIGSRVAQLIDERHEGRIPVAAKELRIPRRTLDYIIAAPASYSPRLPTLARIAQRYGVRLEWLLTGNGDRVAPRPSAFGDLPLDDAALALNDVMRDLDLPDDVQREYVRAAYTVGTASRVLLSGHAASPVGQTFTGSPLQGIIDQQVRAWATLLRELADLLGKDEARARLIAVAPHANRLHASYSGSWIQAGEDIARAAGIIAVHQTFNPPDGLRKRRR
jgi:hypothetical protein